MKLTRKRRTTTLKKNAIKLPKTYKVLSKTLEDVHQKNKLMYKVIL